MCRVRMASNLMTEACIRYLRLKILNVPKSIRVFVHTHDLSPCGETISYPNDPESG